ncbi:MAG TPA: hypothetical protein VF412_18435 [Bdellovibrio sp.]|uniref:tetratricopeptide repeat protein n=1 Tax=Bdellovibrio sp. TaxID=28201 RepID=UPI002EFFF0E1
MKTHKHLLFLNVVVAGVLFTHTVRAEKMNNDTQDLVIKKMDRVLDLMDHKDPSWIPTQQRLADTLAERARTRFMQEVEANCDNCKGSKDDRQRAIKIYENLLSEVKLNEHGPILFQLAHLYEMAGQPDQSIVLFERIIKEAKAKSIDAGIVSRSHASLGDLLFQKGKFKEAKEHYTIALKDKNLENRALAIYNMAWCDFNTDHLKSAIATLEGLLKDPSQITKDTETGSNYDPVFHTDIVRDLGTFYARQNITTKEIASYEKLSPQAKRKELLLNFAQEADRVGQKQAAHQILNRYMDQPDLNKQERLDAFVRLAQVNYDRGETSQSTKDFAKAAEAYKNTNCDDASKCQELQKTMKRYVTELHRSKKVKPDQDLLDAYVIYAKTFPEDKEMIQRGSQVAMDLGNYPLAVELYKTISDSRSFSNKERNEALLNEVAAAEKSQNTSLQNAAYGHYLKNATKDDKYYEVRYQQAYLLYTQKNLKDASKAFDDLAREKGAKTDLRKKSADLALDSLAQMMQDGAIQELAWDYAEIFPANQSEYAGIARKALMNQVAEVANNPKSSKSDLKSVMKTVLKTKLDGAKSDERILIYTNLSIIAKKLGEDEVYAKALYALINIPETPSAKKEQYLEQLTGYYEHKLDFANAYKTALKMHNSKVPAKEMAFRLGTLADLAGMPAEKHYKDALSLGLTGDRALVVRSRLVLLSSNPTKELKVQSGELRRKPSLLNETTLLVYAKTGSKAGLQSILEMKEMRKQSATQFINKQDFYVKLASVKEQISKAKMNDDNDKALGKSITQRMKLLKKADDTLAESLRTHDIAAQLVALNIVAEENTRFVKDLSGTDMPKGLTAAQQRQYVDALKARSKPFLLKAKTAQQKMQDLWNNSPALAQLAKDYKGARPEIQKLLSREMVMIDDLPGRGKMKSAIADALHSSTLSNRDLAAARQTVSENPDNVKDLENLKMVETKIGHPLMPSYLEARLNQIQRGTSL